MPLNKFEEKLVNDVVLLEKISKDEVEKTIDLKDDEATFIGQLFIERGLISEDDLVWVMGQSCDLPVVPIQMEDFDEDVVNTIPAHVCRKLLVVPYLKIASDLSVIAARPLLDEEIKELKQISGCNVSLSLGVKSQIINVLNSFFGTSFAVIEDEQEKEPISSEFYDTEHLQYLASDYSGEQIWQFILDKLDFYKPISIQFVVLNSSADLRFKFDYGSKTLLRLNREWSRIFQKKLDAIISTESSQISEKLFIKRISYQKDEKTHYHTLKIHIHYSFYGKSYNFYPFYSSNEINEFDSHQDGIDEIANELSNASRGLILTFGNLHSKNKRPILSLLDKLASKNKYASSIVPFSISNYESVEQVDYVEEENSMKALDEVMAGGSDVVYFDGCIESLSQSKLNAIFNDGLIFLDANLTSPQDMIMFLFKNYLSNNFAVLNNLHSILFLNSIPVLCKWCRQEKKTKLAQDMTLFEKVGCERCMDLGYSGTKSFYELLKIPNDLFYNMKKKDLSKFEFCENLEKLIDPIVQNLRKAVFKDVIIGNINQESIINFSLEA
ncbi:MAG: hypothetical protein ABIA04_03930 [Pseudomonadota bacterium]